MIRFGPVIQISAPVNGPDRKSLENLSRAREVNKFIFTIRATGKVVVLEGPRAFDSSLKYATGNRGVEAEMYLLPVKTGCPCIVEYPGR